MITRHHKRTTSRKLRAKSRPLAPPAALVFLAILGIFASEGFSHEVFASTPEVSDGAALEACREAQSVASPLPEHSFISESFAPIRPCLPVVAGSPPDSARTAFVRPQTCSGVERQSVLVDALILNKYLHFRESLSSP